MRRRVCAHAPTCDHVRSEESKPVPLDARHALFVQTFECHNNACIRFLCEAVVVARMHEDREALVAATREVLKHRYPQEYGTASRWFGWQ